MAYYSGSEPAGFLGTFNRLSGAASAPSVDPEQAKREILQYLKERPADLKALAELSLPISAVENAVATLHDMGLIEQVAGTPGVYQLSDYAAKALTYITPA